ncbi:MAG TPA: iron transporter [Thermoplasmata archaeon]|nr:iron transporter [Thermoplasmata archaeon]
MQQMRKKLTLDKVEAGRKGVVVKIKGRGPTKRRLMDMGIVSGALIEVIRKAPLGEPIEFKIKGYHLTLRKDEAEMVTVELVG